MLCKRDAVWWTKFELNGRPRYLTTGETDHRKAAAAARRIRVDLEESEGAGKPGRPCGGLTIEMLQALDLARVEDEGLDERRANAVGDLWKPLLKHFGPTFKVNRLTVGDVVAYTGSRRRAATDGEKIIKKGVRGQTVKREVEALVRCLRVAKRDRLINALPFDPDDLPDIRRAPPLECQRGKEWRIEQVRQVFAHFSKKAITAGHLDRCMLILMTGLRLEELHRLKPDWVVPCVGSAVPALLHVPADAAKWGHPRTIPLIQEALEIIERCAPFKKKKPNKSLALASRGAGLNGVVTPRDLRTMFISAAGAADQVAAARLGGHKDISTTNLYLKSTDDRAIEATIRASKSLRGVADGVVTANNAKRQI